MNETILLIIENAVNAAIIKNLVIVQDTEDKNAAIYDFYDVIKENVNIMIEMILIIIVICFMYVLMIFFQSMIILKTSQNQLYLKECLKKFTNTIFVN